MTTRLKKDRELLARRVLAVASAYGASAERFERHDDDPREIHVRIDTGRLSLQFTINSRVQESDVFVLPWNTRVPMDRELDARINEHHRCKLTAVITGADPLVHHITAMLALDKSRDLYEKGEKK